MSHDIHNRFDANNRIVLVLVLDEVEQKVEDIKGVRLEGIGRVGGESMEDFESAVTEPLLWICAYEDGRSF